MPGVGPMLLAPEAAFSKNERKGGPASGTQSSPPYLKSLGVQMIYELPIQDCVYKSSKHTLLCFFFKFIMFLRR